jgi:hypothetical protein
MEGKDAAPAETEKLVETPQEKPADPPPAEAPAERAEWTRCPSPKDGANKCTYVMSRKSNSNSYGKLCPRNALHSVGGKGFCSRHAASARNKLERTMKNSDLIQKDDSEHKLITKPASQFVQNLSTSDPGQNPDRKTEGSPEPIKNHDETDPSPDKPTRKRKVKWEDLPTPPDPESLSNYEDRKEPEREKNKYGEFQSKKQYKKAMKIFTKTKMRQWKKRRNDAKASSMNGGDISMRRSAGILNGAAEMANMRFPSEAPITIKNDSRLF